MYFLYFAALRSILINCNNMLQFCVAAGIYQACNQRGFKGSFWLAFYLLYIDISFKFNLTLLFWVAFIICV